MNKSEKFWNFLANKFDKTESRFEKTHNITITKTKKYLNADDFVLDYGCATGSKTLELAGCVKKIHGIDFASKMIEIAKRKAAELKTENIEFSQATILDEKLKTASFDVILVFNVLHLLDDVQQTLGKILELLKPGGIFISVTPCLGEEIDYSNNFKFLFFLIFKKIGLISQHLERFKISEIENLIANGKFQILETERLYDGITGYFIAAKKI